MLLCVAALTLTAFEKQETESTREHKFLSFLSEILNFLMHIHLRSINLGYPISSD
jgi:hypothetical protein